MKKNNTKEAFFALLRAGLWEQSCKLASYEPIDFKDVYKIAEEQSVNGLIAAGLEHVEDVKVPKNVALEFAGNALQLEQSNTAMNKYVAHLVNMMRGCGIYTLLLKGQGIAKCYERPTWRACGDIDLFLSDDNYIKAKDYIVPLSSFIEPEGKYYKHLGAVMDGWNVELHGNLKGGLSSLIDKELDDIYRDTFNNGAVSSCELLGIQIFLLGVENNVVYVFTHFLQHFYKGGIGIRQICDWCRLIWANRKTLRVKLVESRLRKMGLVSEWKAFAAFAVEYLGMPREVMPFYSYDKKWHRKADRICGYILEVGNFGHNRDMTYFSTKPYLVRKTMSLGRRIGDLMNHFTIFPLDTIKFTPRIIINGLRSAANGE